MPSQTIEVAEVFEPLFTRTDILDFILPGGRVSGKSKTTEILVGVHTAMKPNEDIVIARASYGSIADSVYNETVEVIESIPAFEDQFIYRKSPLRIVRKSTGATIYFMGIGGSTDRTKGFKPKHKVGLVVLEETQELKSKEHLDQTMASLRRRFGSDCKVVIVFNPPAQKLHWINVWTEEKKQDPDYCVIHSTYEDILPFLSDRDVKEIRKYMFENKTYYDYIYGGIPTGMLGSVYPMFNSEIHMVDYNDRQSSKILKDFRIVGCIIGADGAVTHDATAMVPLFIMSNGQAVVGKIFYHDPLINGVKGSFPLIENEGSRWFKELRSENSLDNPYDYMNSIPIVFVVDSAATELYQALNYYFGNRATVYAVKKGTILQMVDTVQSTISKNIVSIYDYHGYFNYTLNKWIKSENLLAYQLEMLIWNEKETGYDNEIPNDVSDAFTYAVYWWFKQTENIVWLDEISRIRQDYYLLND